MSDVSCMEASNENIIAIDIEKVGRRWFRVEISNTVNLHVLGNVEASYVVKFWPKCREWTLTGPGCRVHREAIIEALESYVGHAEEFSCD